MNNKKSKREIALYPQILTWLETYLENKNPKAVVKTYDVHAVDLSDFLQRNKYTKFFPEYATYKIRVDLLGVILKQDKCHLVFVEVKDTPLSLINLSQLLGYCKILKPDFAFLISPKGRAKPLNQLLVHFNRLDILEFNKNKYIRVAKWNTERQAIDNDSVIPPLGSF